MQSDNSTRHSDHQERVFRCANKKIMGLVKSSASGSNLIKICKVLLEKTSSTGLFVYDRFRNKNGSNRYFQKYSTSIGFVVENLNDDTALIDDFVAALLDSNDWTSSLQGETVTVIPDLQRFCSVCQDDAKIKSLLAEIVVGAFCLKGKRASVDELNHLNNKSDELVSRIRAHLVDSQQADVSMAQFEYGEKNSLDQTETKEEGALGGDIGEGSQFVRNIVRDLVTSVSKNADEFIIKNPVEHLLDKLEAKISIDDTDKVDELRVDRVKKNNRKSVRDHRNRWFGRRAQMVSVFGLFSVVALLSYSQAFSDDSVAYVTSTEVVQATDSQVFPLVVVSLLAAYAVSQTAAFDDVQRAVQPVISNAFPNFFTDIAEAVNQYPGVIEQHLVQRVADVAQREVLRVVTGSMAAQLGDLNTRVHRSGFEYKKQRSDVGIS